MGPTRHAEAFDPEDRYSDSHRSSLAQCGKEGKERKGDQAHLYSAC